MGSPVGAVYAHVANTEVYAVVLGDTELPTPWEPATLAELQTAGGEYSPRETVEQKLVRLEEQNLILMDALATVFEELLDLRASLEGGTAK